MKSILKMFFSFLAVLPLAYANATVYYVATTGSNANPGTIISPFQTITYGVNILQPGDTLYIRSGTYAEAIHDIPSGTSWSAPVTVAAYPGETVTVKPGATGWSAVYLYNRYYIMLDRLIFDGANLGSVIGIFIDQGSHHIRLQDGEVKNAPMSGIFIDDGAHHNEMINMAIHDNGTTDFDHGFYISGTNNLVEDSDIYRNAGWGVHVYKEGGTGVANNNIVRNNKIHDNAWVGNRGVGIILSSGNGNMAYNNIIWGNKGGIQIAYGTPTGSEVYNNTIYDNADYGIYLGYYGTDGSTPQPATNSIIKNNIFYQNGTITCGQEICNTGSGTQQSNNLIGTNPLFVNAAGFDFHLLSGSPAIDTGFNLSPDVTDDFEGTSRPQGIGYDIGAYEYVNTTNATVYYVATTGNDANPGTIITAPFQTIAHGVSVLTPGDTLYIRSGTYAEPIKGIPSGISWTSPVTIAAYPGETAVIQPGIAETYPALYTWDKSYIIIDGITFDGTNYNSSIILTYLDGTSHHIRVQNCELRNSPRNGVYINISAHDNEFINDNIHDNGWAPSATSHGIYIEGNNNLVERCIIANNDDYGVHIYSNNYKPSNNIVRNNRVYNNGALTVNGVGIILSSGNNNIAYNNLVWGNAGGGIIVEYHAPDSSQVYNNTVYANGNFGIKVYDYEWENGAFNPPTNTIIKNNILYQNPLDYVTGGTNTSTAANLIGTNPLFTNSSGFDFHLQTGSPAIDAGINLAPDVTDDFDGISRPQGSAYDIGAYEYVSSVTPSVPIANWKFDECSSNQTLIDSAGTNTGTLGFNPAINVEDPTRIAGKSAGALSYDATDDIATIPLTASAQNLSSFTYTAWINPKSAGQNTYGRILSRESSVKFDDFFFLTYPGSTVSAELINTAGTAFNSVASSSAITLNAWNHVAVTYNDAGDRKLHLFVNGIETAYATQDIVTGTLKYTANPISIGNAPSQDRTFDGIIDEVRIYNKALTASEVQGVYNKTLAAPLAPLSFTASQTNVSCNGGSNGSATAAVTGGVPTYTYFWNTGQTTATATGLFAVNYAATITDANGCTKTATVLITQPASISSTLIVVNESFCGANDGSVSAAISGGAAPYAYSWSNGGTTSQITNLTSQSYSVTITDANGCTHFVNASVNCPMAAAQYSLENEFIISPNPNSGIFAIETKEKNYVVEITNLIGEKVYSSHTTIGRTQIDLSGQPSGVYYIKIKSDKEVITQKIIIQK